MSAKPFLVEYDVVEGGQPVLGGHIMKKLHGKYGSERQIQRWSTVENTKNDFPPVSHYRVKKFYKVLQGRWIYHLTFEESYKVLAHSTNPSAAMLAHSAATTFWNGMTFTASSASVSDPISREIRVEKELDVMEFKYRTLKQQFICNKKTWQPK